MGEREKKEKNKGVNSDNSKMRKRKVIQNKVSEWIQIQKKREMKMRVDWHNKKIRKVKKVRDKKLRQENVSETSSYSNSTILNSSSSGVFTFFRYS